MASCNFQGWWNAGDHADVLLNLHINSPGSDAPAGPGASCSSHRESHQQAAAGFMKRQREWSEADRKMAASSCGWPEQPSSPAAAAHHPTQHVKSYSLHAVILSAASAYFNARLSNTWQGEASISDRSCGRPPGMRYELVEHIEADEEEALEVVLRLMYGCPIPEGSSVQLLLRCLRLADRLDAVQGMDAVLARLGAEVGCKLNEDIHAPKRRRVLFEPGLTVQMFSMPPGAADRPMAQRLVAACQSSVRRQYCNVSAVNADEEQRRHFCSLPFAAVLAWAESDELEVYSENCVICLLTAWVTAQQAAGVQQVSAEQLEQLAQQVRVLHLGPAYHYHVLPHLKWFTGCSSMQHLPFLLAYKGTSSEGCAVFPRAQLKGKRRWDGAKQWVAAPRKRSSSRKGSTLMWQLGDEQLQQLYAGRRVWSRIHAVVNGFPLRLYLQPTSSASLQPGSAALGLYFSLDEAAAVQLGLPWSPAASVAVDQVQLSMTGSELGLVVEHKTKWGSLRGGRGRGCPRFLKQAALSVDELVGPYLKGGQLHIKACFSEVDTA